MKSDGETLKDSQTSLFTVSKKEDFHEEKRISNAWSRGTTKEQL